MKISHFQDTLVGTNTPTEDMVGDMGSLLPLMGKEHLDKISGGILKGTGDRFSRVGCMLKNVTEYIQNKINQATR